MITINGTKVVTETFPNGETKLDLFWIIEECPMFIDIKWRYESDSEFMLLKFISDYLEENSFSLGVDLHILYMPYSRMDRSENGSVFTLQSAARVINEMNFHTVYVYEPHSSKTAELIVNCVPRNVTQVLLEDAIEKRKDDNFIVFFPDKGAKERYDMGKYPHLTGSKKRDFDTGRIVSYEIDTNNINVKGKDVYIIDDLCSYGGTFVKASEKLRELEVNDIYLIVAHAESSIMKGELFDYIKEVCTTNSIISQNYLFTNLKDLSSKKEFPINIKEII